MRSCALIECHMSMSGAPVKMPVQDFAISTMVALPKSRDFLNRGKPNRTILLEILTWYLIKIRGLRQDR